VQLLVWGSSLPSKISSDVYQKWFTGDFFGFAFITPILLVLSTRWIQDWPKEKIAKFILYFVVSLVFGQAVFFGWLSEYIDMTGRGFAVLFFIAFFRLSIWAPRRHVVFLLFAGAVNLERLLWAGIF